jgi:steroid 5-alpha reductase family enzyme
MFLLTRVLARKQDDRFNDLRGSFVKFGAFWAGQAVWVAAVSSPVVLANVAASEEPIGGGDKIGWLVWAVGWLMETVADDQKRTFNSLPPSKRPSPFINSGLWRFSRHPNYFGECLVWLGIWLSASRALPWTWSLFTFVASPVLTIVLLTKVSGMPIAEQRDDRRFMRSTAHSASYIQYKYTTSPIITIPPSWYARIDQTYREWFFFEQYRPKTRRVKRTLLSNSLASSPNR